MLTTLRLCYFKGIKTREQTVGFITSAVCRFAQSLQSVKDTWQGCSIFDRSPLDEIAVERLFEIERNFLKVNGYEYPPLRTSRPPSRWVLHCHWIYNHRASLADFIAAYCAGMSALNSIWTRIDTGFVGPGQTAGPMSRFCLRDSSTSSL